MTTTLAPDQVGDLDPQHPAPPCRVTRDPNNDGIGHDGRTLPLIGGMRPYAFDVILDEDDRLYADTYADVFALFAPGYKAASDELLRLISGGADEDEVGKAQEALFEMRCAIATQARVDLQKQRNAESRTNGNWEKLTAAEREQLELAENGQAPVGTDDPILGDAAEYGVWEPAAPLVISTGDYAPYDPEGKEAPESRFVYKTTVENGEEVEWVWHFRQEPPNFVRIEPEREHELYNQLVELKWLKATYRPIDLPDERFITMIEEGARVLAERENKEGDTSE